LALQINDASHFIDGSQVYGSNDRIVSTLRLFNGGKLKSIIDENQEFCPHAPIVSSDTNEFFYNSGKLFSFLYVDNWYMCVITHLIVAISL